jgi:hypothetical protein
MLKYLLGGIVCFLTYSFVSGHYNALEAKKYRERKYSEVNNKDTNSFWPQEKQAKVITYPTKALSPANNKKQNTSPVVKTDNNEWNKIAANVSSALIWLQEQSRFVYLKCANLNIASRTNSKSPFLDIFHEEKQKQQTDRLKRITSSFSSANAPRPQTVKAKVVPQQVVRPPVVVPSRQVELAEEIVTSFPIPVMTGSNNIEIYQSAPPVPRANMNYAIVSYDR